VRDLRDPIKLGEIYLEMRGKGVDIPTAIRMPADNYTGDGWMSSNPAEHHMHEFFTNIPDEAGDLSE